MTTSMMMTSTTTTTTMSSSSTTGNSSMSSTTAATAAATAAAAVVVVVAATMARKTLKRFFYRMTLSKTQAEAVDFYDQHYRVVFDSSLREARPVKLTDPEDGRGRICRQRVQTIYMPYFVKGS
jgi:hypothetical protein